MPLYSTIAAKEFYNQTMRYENYINNKFEYQAPDFRVSSIQKNYYYRDGANVGINSKGTLCVLRKKFP